MRQFGIKGAEGWLAAGLGLAVFAACRAGLPSAAAVSVPELAGPLWLAASRLAGAGGLGLLAAACGGAAAAALPLVAGRLFRELARPLPEARFDAGGELETGEAAPDGAAALGGAVAGLAFAFGGPLWRAASAPGARTLDALLLLLAGGLLLRCHDRGGRDVCVAAAFVCGLGAAESPAFLALLPAAAAVTLRAAVDGDGSSERAVPFCLLALAAGAASGLGLAVWARPGEPGWEAARAFCRAYGAALCGGLAPGACLAAWAAPAAALLLSALCLRASALGEERPGPLALGLMTALTGAVAAWLLGGADVFAGPGGAAAPVLPALMASLAAGCLAACWLKAGAAEEEGGSETGVPPFPLRLAGRCMCGVLVAAVLAAGVLNLRGLLLERVYEGISNREEVRSDKEMAGRVNNEGANR